MNSRTKLFSLLSIFLLLIGISAAATGSWGNDIVAARNHESVMKATFLQDFPTPPTSITSALATVPVDAVGIPEQANFDLYSWLTFIALNWPASTGQCGPNLNKSILSGGGPVVWETYLTDSQVFVAPGSKPSPWCPPVANGGASAAQLARMRPLERRLARLATVKKVFSRHSKASPTLSERFPGIEEAVGGVLTDQNGRFVRYEVRMNRDEYRYLTDPANNLWNKKGQDAFTGTITFPVGPSKYGPTGAIEIKAAWKVLSPAEISGKRFYMTKGIVFNDDAGNPSPGTNPVVLGLVGLHIVHKTAKQPRWIWSTFEHVDNLRPPPGSLLGAKASFTNPDCPPATCPPNVQTAPTPYTELDKNGKPINKPVQVTRVNPVDDVSAGQLNTTFQNLLKGSVWANYQLVSAQWVGELGTLPKPAFLANTVLETFNQLPSPPSDGPVPYPNPNYNPFAPGVSASCMKCHSVATTASGKLKGDFSFLLGNAQ